MDIVVKDLIQRIRSVHRDAFIAGGFVRDHELDQSNAWRDVDIFLPYIEGTTSSRDIIDKLFAGTPVRGFDCLATRNNADHMYNNSKINRIAHCKFYGINIDLVPISIKKDTKDIVNDILSEFDFGINQCAYDGDTITKTKAFIEDCTNRTCTLLSLDDMGALPKAMVKAAQLEARYGLDFQTDLLQLKKGK